MAFNDFDEVNAILYATVDDHMIEPIDDPDCHPIDYADVVGIFDEVYPEPSDSWLKRFSH